MDKNTRIEAAVRRLLTALEVDWEHDENFKETPRRVASWLAEKFTDEDAKYVQRGLLAKKVFPSSCDELVTMIGVEVFGLCPHHLLPVIYNVSLGYLPKGHVIGLSKLARLAELELGSVGTQEDLTGKLADGLTQMLSVLDVAVVVRGAHQCMLVRGVKQKGAVTITSEMRGTFRTSQNLRNEFLSLVRNGGYE